MTQRPMTKATGESSPFAAFPTSLTVQGTAVHPGIHLLMIYSELLKDKFANNEQCRARKKRRLPVPSTSKSPSGDFLGWGHRLDLPLQGMF